MKPSCNMMKFDRDGWMEAPASPGRGRRLSSCTGEKDLGFLVDCVKGVTVAKRVLGL